MAKSGFNFTQSQSSVATFSIQSIWKGKIPYQKSLISQEQLKDQICKSQKAFFMGFECPACITLGLRGKKEKDLSSTIEEYKKKQIEVLTVKRGGQATLHAPGQLVIYPIMDLLKWKIRPRDFLSLLEQITITTLKEYGVSTEKTEDSAGLFTEKGKIAFFGIHISRGVSQHGLAINVRNDLALFNLIRSCGISHRPHDSFQNQGVCSDLKRVFSCWCKTAKSIFYSRVMT